jgi:hypothetical protein
MIATRCAVLPLTCLFASLAAAEPSREPLSHADAEAALAATLSRLIEGAIPLQYEKQKDWGATKEITVGLRTAGKGWNTRLTRRKRAVNHGVWKHYKLRLIEPRQNLAVELVDLRPLEAGRVAFTLQMVAKVDVWARAKVYQYGVHVIALEMEGDVRVRVAIDGELGVEVRSDPQKPAVAVVPLVVAARLQLEEFHLRRVSNAHGPVIRELGDGVRKLAEEELNGPPLVAKLNRAIEKNRDRLTFHPTALAGENSGLKWVSDAGLVGQPASPIAP